MGEFDLEKRLKNLKSSYDDMPSTTSVDHIMKHIEDHEKPSERNRNKKKRFHFNYPYVASFIGVLLIVGVLAGQMLFNKDMAQENDASTMDSASIGENPEKNTESVPPEADEIEGRLNELKSLYETKEKALIDALHIKERPEQFSFVREAYAVIEQFEQGDFVTKDQLDQAFYAAKDELEWKMLTPGEMLEQLEKERAEPEDLDVRLSEVLNKQEELMPIMQRRWNSIAEQYKVFPDMVEQLNEVDSLANEQLEKEVEFFRYNGYRFLDAGEGMIDLQIDYTGLEQDFPDSALVGYFELIKQTDHVARDAELILSWNQLSDLIVDLEQFLLQHPNFEKDPEVFEQYKRLLNIYVYGMDNSMTFHDNGMLRKEVRASYDRFLDTYADTETYFILKSYYEVLEKHGFEQTTEVSGFQIEYPELYNEEVVKDAERFYYGNIFPLSKALMSRYEAISGLDSEEQINNVLEGLSPFDVMRMYMYASTNDYSEMVYKLYIKGEKYGTPSKEQYMEEGKAVPNADFQPFSDTFQSAELVTTSDGEAVIMLDAGIYDGERKGFQIVKNEAGVWKIEFMPMQ